MQIAREGEHAAGGVRVLPLHRYGYVMNWGLGMVVGVIYYFILA